MDTTLVMNAFVSIPLGLRAGPAFYQSNCFAHQFSSIKSGVSGDFLGHARQGLSQYAGRFSIGRAFLPGTFTAQRGVTRPFSNLRMMIKVGDKFPSGKFGVMRNGAPAEVSTDEVFKGQTVVICGVPGAFTGTCNARHLPGYVDLADKFRELGAKVACLATNDAFVMDAWMKMRNAEGKVMPLSDGDASLLQQMGLTWDTGKFGGVRAVRFSMIVDDGVVKALNVEQGGAFTEKSAAETALSQLKAMK